MRKKLIVLLLASMLALSSCGNTGAPVNSSGNNTEQPADGNGSTSSEDSLLQIGDEGTLKDWSITVTNAQITDSIKENNYFGFTPEEGNKYFTVDLTITNNGKNAANFLPSVSLKDDVSVKILYKEDYEYSSTLLLGYGDELHNTTVNPLSTKSGVITFELPDSIASTDEELILKISAGKNNLLYKVR